jgi:colicin import membrane protein
VRRGLKMYDLSERISCSDGTCTGIINERGFCNICGKPLKGWQEREEQKKIEKDKREEEIEEKKQKEEKNTEIQEKEEKIDIKNLLQKEIAKAKEEKRIKEQVEEKSQDQGARLLGPVVLAVSQLESELSNNKQIGFRISDHHVEIHLGKERKVKVEAFRHGAGHKFHAVEEVEYEHPEHHVPNRDLIFETSGETINFLVKVCAEFIVSQNE